LGYEETDLGIDHESLLGYSSTADVSSVDGGENLYMKSIM
jgi:hypothetical protein